MDCKDWGKKKEKFGKGAKCKEKVKQKKSAGKEENVKRQRSFGKEDFYENEVKRQQNSGKAAAKCGARAKNHKGRTTCKASVCEQRMRAATASARGEEADDNTRKAKRAYASSACEQVVPEGKTDENRRQKNGRERRPSDGGKWQSAESLTRAP